ncbi:MAG: hypothetical protein Q9187_003512 [Circinaria calcarea]
MSRAINQGNSSRCQESNSNNDIADLDTQDIKDQLLELLHAIHKHETGSFATSGSLPHSANPGLHVHGLGIIGLPLSERLAVELAGICHQAPFGKGRKTVVDTTVRRTWELNPSQFEIRNPAWQDCVKNAVQSVGKELGIVGGMSSISAQLYKMLLYEKGAFFERHTDSEKAHGMFGTLVIALPSSHTGGEVEVIFNGQRKTLSTADASDFGYSYLAWYADVEHAVASITSGYRLVLTYNLVHSAPGVPQLAASLGNETLKLGNVLSLWKTSLENSYTTCPKMLAYMLQHKYTDANLRYDHLKGMDRLKAQYLKEACREQGFCIILANLEHTVFGGCDEEEDYYSGAGSDNEESDNDHDDDSNSEGLDAYHKISDVCDSSIQLKVMLNADGSKIGQDITIREDDIVQENPFARKPDDEDFSGYTGNEGVSATHFYRNSCLVIVPEDYQIDLLFNSAKEGKKNINTWVGDLIDEHRAMPQDRKRKINLTRLCQLVIETNEARNREKRGVGKGCFNWRTEEGFADDTLGLVVKAALQLRNPVLFESAASITGSRWPSPVYYEIGQILQKLGLSDWHKGLKTSMTSTTEIHHVYQALTNLWDGYIASQHCDLESSDSKALDNWIRQRMTFSLSVDIPLVKEDGKALVGIAQKYGEGYMFRNILPLVKRHISNDTSFSVSFLECLFEAGEQTKIRKGVVSNIFRDILCNLIPYFKLEFHTPVSKRMRPMDGIRSIYEPQLRRDDSSPSAFMAGDDIATLIGYCISLHLDGEIDQILDRIKGEAAIVDISAFQILLLPFLRSLLALMQRYNIPYTDSRYQACFQNLLELYRQRFIGAEPPAPPDWAKLRKGCGRFPLAEKRRRHLENQIRSTYEHVTDRTGIPYTLVITKNHNTWKQSWKAWQQRCDEAARNIRSIGLPALKSLLTDRFTELTELTSMKLATQTPTRAPLATISQARGPAETVAKISPNNPVPRQPSHIIDLTE